MDDRDLLLDFARRNSSAAFTTLVQRHIDLVYSAALRRVGGDHHRAAEVTQTVFTDLARKAEKVAAHPVIAGWLHQSTRWAATTLLRAERRRTLHEQAAAAELSVTAAGASTPDWEALRPVLDSALDSLRPDDRDAVLLRYFSNLSYAEIGARFGVGENTRRTRGADTLPAQRARRIAGRARSHAHPQPVAGFVAVPPRRREIRNQART